MPRQVSEFRIVVASPLDMSQEREVVFDSLRELNRSLDIQGISIKALGWEEYTTPGVDTYPQEVINSQLLQQYDILIGIFGTRLGTQTAKARSGTIEEIDRALSCNDNVLGQLRVQVYFQDRLDSISAVSLADLQAVEEVVPLPETGG
jgi:hypothetical protein